MTINGDGGAVREYVHVLDVADAVRCALPVAEPGHDRLYNVGTGRGASVNDLVAAAERVTGRPVPVEHGPPADEPRTLVAETRRIADDLGWTATRSGVENLMADAWAAYPGRIGAP